MPSAPFYSPRSVALVTAMSLDVSGIATGASVIVLPANPKRVGLLIAQPFAAGFRVWVNFGAAAGVAPTSLNIQPGSFWMSKNGACPTEYVAVQGPAGQIYTVKEFY